MAHMYLTDEKDPKTGWNVMFDNDVILVSKKVYPVNKQSS